MLGYSWDMPLCSVLIVRLDTYVETEQGNTIRLGII